MLFKAEPDFPRDFGSLNGVREDFNGAGVFLYRSKTRKPGQWVSINTSFLLMTMMMIVRDNSAQPGIDEDAAA